MQRTKSGRSAARLAAASATAMVLHFGATGSCGGEFPPSATQQIAPETQAAPAIGADWADWLDFMMMFHQLESLLYQSATAPGGEDDKVQADAVARARDQSNRFWQSGLRESLSVVQIDGGFSAIEEVRRTILDHPQSFSDPFWNSYLQTLNELALELDDRATGAS